MFSSQLGDILEYVEKLRELDTENVEPMLSVMGIQDVLREDVPRPSLTHEAALATAPASGKPSFRVPTVVE